MIRSLQSQAGKALPALLLVALLLPLHTATAHAPIDLPFAAPAAPAPLLPTQDAASDVTFEVTAISSDFGPEEYKADDRLNTRNPNDLENQTHNWNNSLGHRITFTVQVSGANDAELLCSDRFVAETYVDTVAGRLWGWTNGTFKTDAPGGVGDLCPTGLPGVRVFTLTFDLDGAPATATGTRYPVLGGVQPYTANLDLYYSVTPSVTNPSGKGPIAGSYQIPFSVATPILILDQPFLHFPESTLRLFSDTGATPTGPDTFPMPARPLTRDANTTLTIQFNGAPVGAPFERIDHYALRTGPGLESPADLPDSPAPLPPLSPVTENIQNQDDRLTVAVERDEVPVTNDTVPASRVMLMQLRGAEFPTATSLDGTIVYTPLQIIAIHLPASVESPVTGLARFVLPISDQSFPVRTFQIDPGVAGVGGTTSVTLRDPGQTAGGATGTNAGDLFALREGGVAEVLTKARLQREPGTQWIRGSLSHGAFPSDPVSSYLILGLLYGPSDEFLGMNTMRRGIGLEVGSLRMVEGRSGTIPLTVTNLANDFDDTTGEADFAMVIQLQSNPNFPDGSAYNHTTGSLAEGQSVTIEVPIDGTIPGDFNIVFRATNGELEAQRDSTVKVISKEQAREENRKWYEIPAPPASLLVVALLGMLTLLRRGRQ